MNLPNKITLSRICMIPLFVLFFYLEAMPCNYLIAAIIFCIAAFTDALDGHIARSRGLVTNLGKFLDPIADKVLVSTAFIVLLTRPYVFDTIGGMAGWIAAGILISLIMARELIISGFRTIAAGQNVVLAADKWGKLKTVFQDVSIALMLACSNFVWEPAGEVFAYISFSLFVISAILTVASGVNYIVKNRKVLSTQEED